ncbi:rhomboid family intramembrane serine protease [Larkinella arboricola]|uniref:Membrane associated rhomboid family serine protease n=1 Tax=Larkinella arboricola TaxID=643671 RepID=A0A327WYE5_LARAB|nr:rhomboid family intramembrane serine protease [Larkinella arboricola]RAJ98181.1 membrane associated rhomboid family serine protease [Larkinella arboricola]
MSGLLDDFRNEFNKPNNTLVQLILINTIVFLLLLILKVVVMLAVIPGVYDFVITQLRIPASLSAFITKPWTLITYFFTHEDVFHILFNMLFLYWFGRLVDEYLGNRRLVALYMLGGITGGLAYIAIYNLLPYFHGAVGRAEMLGASAAAFSVAVGASTLLPNYTFHLLFFGPVRIKYIAFFYIVLSLARSIGPNAGGELSHLGGALVGFLFIKMLQNGTDLGQPIYWIMDGWQSLFRKKPPVKVSYRQRSASMTTGSYAASSSSSSAVAMPDQDEIDAILDKISRSGYESLTREEKQKLFRASQRG